MGMMQRKRKKIARRVVDVCLTVILLFLMAYQVTGQSLHEWIGLAEFTVVIFHQILNHKWYAALFKGKYNTYRKVSAVIDVLLIASFFLTALCGMAMSSAAVPFLYGMIPIGTAQQLHLSMSYWTFILMGLHLELHIPFMTARHAISQKTKRIRAAIFAILAAAGLYFLLNSGMEEYLFFRAIFASFDDEKPAALVFLENMLMLLFFVFIVAECSVLCRKKNSTKTERKREQRI